MDPHSEPVEVRLAPTRATSDLVALFRRACFGSVAEIAAGLKLGAPILVGRLYGREHEASEPVVLTLLRELEARGLEFEVLVRGRSHSFEVFLNTLERYHQISYDTRMEMELESGDPSEEALKWATGDFAYPKYEG